MPPLLSIRDGDGEIPVRPGHVAQRCSQLDQPLGLITVRSAEGAVDANQ